MCIGVFSTNNPKLPAWKYKQGWMYSFPDLLTPALVTCCMMEPCQCCKLGTRSSYVYRGRYMFFSDRLLDNSVSWCWGAAHYVHTQSASPCYSLKPNIAIMISYCDGNIAWGLGCLFCLWNHYRMYLSRPMPNDLPQNVSVHNPVILWLASIVLPAEDNTTHRHQFTIVDWQLFLLKYVLNKPSKIFKFTISRNCL